jgi:hypothetical protein
VLWSKVRKSGDPDIETCWWCHCLKGCLAVALGSMLWRWGLVLVFV